MISELFGLNTREHAAAGPLWMDGGFDDLVAASAPRRFAIVQRFGSGAGFRVAAWGMVFGDRAEVITVDGRRLTVSPADSVVSWFDRSPAFIPHLVWWTRSGRLRGVLCWGLTVRCRLSTCRLTGSLGSGSGLSLGGPPTVTGSSV